MSDGEVVVGRRRGPRWHKVSHGVHRAVVASPEETSVVSTNEARRRSRDERLADLRALQQVLPESVAFTHLTAAEVHGLWLPPMPLGLPVFASLPKEHERPRRRGLQVSRLGASMSPVLVDGVRVMPMPEVLLACARHLGSLDLVVLTDCALGRGLCSLDALRSPASPRRRGAPALRAAAEYADARAESPWESLLRMFHVLCEVPVEPQFEVYDDLGHFVARGDLRISGSKTLHEYDGAVHRDRRTHINDLARERRLANNGWVRRGYTSGDLLGRGHLILREADATLGRPHDPRRIQSWLTALRHSLFTSDGRRRLLERCNAD